MNDRIKRIKIGDAAHDFLENSLREGLTLSQLVLNTIALNCGDVYTYLPEKTSPTDVLRFNAGGKVEPKSVGRNETHGVCYEVVEPIDEPVKDEINHFLGLSSNNMCVFEDIFASSGDSFFKINRRKISERFVFMGEETYLLLYPEDAKTELIDATLHSVPTGHYLNFFMTSFSSGEKIKIKKFGKITEDILRQFALRVEKIVTIAYDGESYIVWQKR